MTYLNISILLISLIALLILCYFYKRKKKIDILKEYSSVVRESLKEFNLFFDNNNYLNHKKYINWEIKYVYIKKKVSFDLSKSKLPDDLVKPYNDFFNILENKNDIINKYNDKFVEIKKNENKDFLDTVESFKLDDQQRDCIIHEEDTMLIIAGAGTGKTSTIVGKVAYLINKLNINPDEILLLSFTNKSSKELEERITRATDREMNVYTFHKLGYSIISTVLNEKKEIAFSDNQTELFKFVESIFYSNLKNEAYLKIAKDYFYDFPCLNYFEISEPSQYEEQLIGNDGEMYKSKQEVSIANFLYYNQIKYQYEKSFHVKTSTKKYSQYRPDFYLNDYEIYIEHFGIDKNGNPPKIYSKSEQENYLKGITWKKLIHKKYKTKFIETYSYEFEERTIFQNLEKKLKAHNVFLNSIVKSREDLRLNIICKKKYPLIVKLFCSFLNLMKSNLKSLNGIENDLIQFVDKFRYELFLNLFKPIYEKYELYLKETDRIDFSDMISKATEYVFNRKYNHDFKYIIIDEFQDMSFGRYKLIEAMLSQNDNIKLFCVGDDWQSIYRFTGTDISIIIDFEKHFGYFKELKIENTYRFPSNVIKVSSEIIMLNENQRVKQLHSSRDDDSLPIIIKYYKKETYESQLNDILENFKINSTVFLIGRYNFEKPVFIDSIRRKYKNLDIQFLTVHKAKGLEADNIILLNIVHDSIYGFPANLEEDPVMNLVLNNQIVRYEEERRLFYVALTRTKNKIYILNHTSSARSLFLKELIKICDNNFKIPVNFCPSCHGQVLLRGKFDHHEFYGCSRYPVCDYNKKKYKTFKSREVL